MASHREYSLQEKAYILQEIDSRGLPNLCHVAKDLEVSISSLSRILKEREAINRALTGSPRRPKAEEAPGRSLSWSRCSHFAKACLSRLRKFFCADAFRFWPTRIYTVREKALILQQIDSHGGPSNLRAVSKNLGISISSLSRVLKEGNRLPRSYALESSEDQREGRTLGSAASSCSSRVRGWWSRLKTRCSGRSISRQEKVVLLKQVASYESENLRELSDDLNVSISTLSRVLKERETALRRRGSRL